MELTRRAFGTLTGSTLLSLALPAGTGSAAAPTASPSPSPAPGTVTFDPYSMLIDGRRVPLWSGEMHPFRLPSPSLWRDVLQKMRANGYNAVSVYVSWNYHSPAPGSYDFTGVRDLGRFLRTAAETGLYVIARPGPYINAEVDAGGYPGWLATTAGRARGDDPTYLGYVDEWLTAVNAVISRHLYTTGEGSVVLYQLENEYASHTADATGRGYMSHLYEKVRADGIDVPLFHNDKGRNGYWTPGSFPTGGEEGRYLYAFDGYPSPSSTPPDWGFFGTGGAKGGATASPLTPGFTAEFGGGWFDPWGGAEFGGLGYAESRRTRDAAYERRFYLTNLANGIKVHNVYMTFGGTSWGWIPAPVVYTSYDYGAAIDEARNLTSKVVPMHQIGMMLESFPDLAALDRAGDVTATTPAGGPAVRVYHLTSPEHGSHVYLVRNDSSADAVCALPVETAAGAVTVPVGGDGLRVVGKDMKLLATGLSLGNRTLRWTTAQPMLRMPGDGLDLAVLTGRPGDPVEAVLDCAAPPSATVLAGDAQTVYDADAGTLRVNTVLGGLTRVLVRGGGCDTPLLLLFADDPASAVLWSPAADGGPVLVRGPALVRTAERTGAVLRLTGDTTEDCDLEVWAPDRVKEILWNGRRVAARATASGGLAAVDRLTGPRPVTLPALTGWRYAEENPESDPAFDDSSWRVCDLTTSHSTTPVPAGSPVLFADDYGFHYGDVWYRAQVADAAEAATLALSYATGTQGLLMAWWDGRPLGTHRMPVPAKSQDTQGTWTATAAFPVPAGLGGEGPHTVAVLVRKMAHEEDGGANDAFKSARGLTLATLDGSSAALAWRIQGGTAGDAVRGPLNTGGLYGERAGWHLPDFPDRHWQRVPLPSARVRQGVSWYRTAFTLDLDGGVDASVGLTLDDDPARAYRVQIFLNGWNMGQYVNDVGPQHTFVLPAGVLRTRGSNTLALAVLADGTTPAGPGAVSLTLLGCVAGGVPVEPVRSPGYGETEPPV